MARARSTRRPAAPHAPHRSLDQRRLRNLVIQPGARATDTVVRDRTKPVGYRFRNNSPVNGANVWVTVSIFDHGKLHRTKRYCSHHPAVNGVFVVGTGT